MTPEDSKNLHSLYVLLTGLDLPYEPLWMDSDLYLWEKKFCPDDLRLVAGHIKRRYMADHDIMVAMLRWTKLFRHLDYFSELLAEAKAMQKKPATERQKVLADAGRPEQAKDKPAVHVGKILRGEEFLEAMRKLRESI
jgi:hypothetical protein